MQITTDYNWIHNAICSCNTTFQTQSAYKMVQLFTAKYPDEHILADELTEALVLQQATITHNPNALIAAPIADKNATLLPTTALLNNNAITTAVGYLYAITIAIIICLSIYHLIISK